MKSRSQFWCDIQCASVYLSIMRTHQVSEATHRKATGSCDKLQQSHPLLIIHLLHKLSTDQSMLIPLSKSI